MTTGPQSRAIGAAFYSNTITNTVEAYIAGATVTSEITAAEIAATNNLDHAIEVTANEQATIYSVVIGVAGSKSTTAAGSIGVNVIKNTVDAHIKNSVVTADGSVYLKAKDDSEIDTGAGGIAISLQGSADNKAVGAAIITNNITSEVSSYIQDADVSAINGNLDVLAVSEPTIIALVIGLGVAASGKASNSGSVVVNNILNTSVAYVSGSDTDIHGGTGVTIKATDDVNLDLGVGSIAGGGDQAFGGADPQQHRQ